MKYRKLRIAWSVAWGVVTVLLVALWVRSYWSAPALFGIGTTPNYFMIGVEREIVALRGEPDLLQAFSAKRWQSQSFPVMADTPKFGFMGFYYTASSDIGMQLRFPIYLMTIITICVANIPWRWWRFEKFSIRALLIATTLTAIGLGLIVWLTQ
jgi:hypothetical protein